MKSKLLVGVVLAAAVAGAETFTYTWDGSSASYGDGRVAVAYNDGSVASLTVTVAEGDLVVFEGETPVSFAAAATVMVNGRGSLTFKNAAETLGALTFMSDAPRLDFDIETDFPDLPKTTLYAGGKLVLAFPGALNLSDYVFAPIKSSLYYNNKTTINKLFCGFPERTETTYEYQGQNDNGAATRCIFFRFIQCEDGIAITNAASYSASKGHEGEDFRGSVPGKNTASLQIVKAGLVAERLEGRREVTFESDFTAGGQITVSGGVNLRGTAQAFKTGHGETFDLSVAFDCGSLTCLEFGGCNHAATISGTDGTIYYLTPDVTSDIRSHTYEDTEIVGSEWGIPTTNLVVLKNTALSSVTGLTARIKWNQYQPSKKGPSAAEQDPGANFTDNPTPVYFEIDPNLETIAYARFQMQRPQGGLAFCAPIVLTQVGSDIAVRKVNGKYEWTSEDARTWDPWEPTGAHGDYNADHFFITNLTFYTSKPIGGYSEATFDEVNSFGGDRISTVFRPGLQSAYRVKVNAYKTLAPGSGHFVFDGARIDLNVTQTDAGKALAWASGIYGNRNGYGFTVYPGGRVLVLQEKNNHPNQPISVCGGDFGFLAGVATATISNGKLSPVTYDSHRSCYDYIGNLTFSDGGRTFGLMPNIGAPDYARSPRVTVTGTKPCRCDSGFKIIAGDPAKPVTATFDIADVTDGAAADLTVATVIAEAYASMVKTGSGTLLFEEKNTTAAGFPICVVQGVIAFGCTDCFTPNAVFSLEGGSLTATAGTVNTIGSLAVTEDATLTLGDGSSLTVADPTAEWTKGKLVNIVGDPDKCTLTFGGEGSTLSRSQVRALRWNGEKCHIEPNGSVRPGGEGVVLIVR